MRALLILAVVLMAGCQAQQQPHFGHATVYTTPGTVGGVSYSKYEVTPL